MNEETRDKAVEYICKMAMERFTKESTKHLKKMNIELMEGQQDVFAKIFSDALEAEAKKLLAMVAKQFDKGGEELSKQLDTKFNKNSEKLLEEVKFIVENK